MISQEEHHTKARIDSIVVILIEEAKRRKELGVAHPDDVANIYSVLMEVNISTGKQMEKIRVKERESKWK